LRDAQLARILGAVNEVIGLSELTELTLEANPISLTYEKALAYRSLGINRLSIGVQSFNSAFLHRIGRPHRAYEAIATYEAARRAGFNNVSIDLMFALPGQQTIDLVEDLNQLVALAPEHISCFTLETIPMTPLWVKRQLGILEAPMPEMEREIEMYQVVVAHLTAAGYHHYGALNFARPGKESEHNRIAFQAPQGEYLGWGNSAYSFMNEHVFCNEEDVGRYIEAVSRKRSPVSFIKRASLHELASRLVLLGLKFLKVKHADFENRFGLPMDYFFSEQLSKLSQQHLISVDQEGVALTELGTIYVNNVCKEFFVGANRGSKQYIQYKPTINAKTINYLVAKAENNGKKSHV
jgi:oxygen-independent coproporphyrinogen-3 oxidase